jgi:hypothetical protein
MATSLIAHYTEVLEKISLVDRRTFRKELRKALRRLTGEEREQLKMWFRTACVCRPPMRPLAPLEVRSR